MWRCTTCQSEEVEELAWVDMNTSEYMGGTDDEYFCRKCDSHTSVWFDSGDGDNPIIEPKNTNEQEE